MKQLFIAVLTLIMGLPVCDDACLAANVSKNPARSPEYAIMWNEIYYTTSNSSIVEILNPDAFDAKIISNTYEDGQGIITFDNNVTSIGDFAFLETKLTSIQIPNNVTSIGQEAFAECYSLTSISIPSSVTSIGENAFYSCRNLTDISVDQYNRTYDSRDNCNAIIETASNTLICGCQNTIIPLSVTSIGENAFGNNPCLTSVTIPNSVYLIKTSAFDRCDSLTSVTNLAPIPQPFYAAFDCQDTLHVIPGCGDAYRAAKGWKDFKVILEDATVQNTIIFYTTEYEECITIYKPVAFGANVASNTYQDGQGRLVFDKIVTSLGDDAFCYCYFLKSITLPDGLTSIGEDVFHTEFLRNITIPNSVTSIGNYAFSYCSGLTGINIPSNVTSIGKGVFTGCTGLTSITVEAGNSHYDSRDNCNAIIETESNTLIQGCRNTIVPNGVTSIGINAFYNCDSLTSITLPAGLTSIGESAFIDCDNLASVTLPAGLISIGDLAFDKCRSLNRIDIPGSVTSIGESAFYGCYNLASVTLHNGLTSIGHAAFAYCDNLTNIDIPNSVTTIGGSSFSHCSELTSITISNNVKSIEGYTFDACTSLKNVTLPENLWLLGGSAFDNCNELTHITLPGTTEHIGPHAIWSTKLTSITNLATTPQYLYSDSFAVQDTLHVLPGCGDAYRAADVWKDFKIILEDAESNTSINAVHDSESAGQVFSVEGLPAGSRNKSGLYIQDRKKFLVR